MKKIVISVLLLFSLFSFAGCKSTKVADESETGAESEKPVENKPAVKKPDFSKNGGKTLDSYWDSYYATKDTYYLDCIAAYTESEDLLLSKINETYSTITANNKDLIDYLCDQVGLCDFDKTYGYDYDLDYISIVLLKEGDDTSKDMIRKLYSLFPGDLLVRNAVKSSAYWSLASNAEQIKAVKNYLIKKVPDMSLKTSATFADFLGIKEEQLPE